MSQSEEMEHVLDGLRQKGMRITEGRKAILQLLMDSNDHPTAEEIYHELKPKFDNLSLATIYNNLNFFVSEGLVYEMKFSNVSSRYDYLGHSHYHIICRNCGKIADFHGEDLDELYKSAAEQTDYLVQFDKLELYGICPTCQKLMTTK
ncbi:Fur family transcriptional regulator [Aerococcaceae bacterium WGS1372]